MMNSIFKLLGAVVILSYSVASQGLGGLLGSLGGGGLSGGLGNLGGGLGGLGGLGALLGGNSGGGLSSLLGGNSGGGLGSLLGGNNGGGLGSLLGGSSGGGLSALLGGNSGGGLSSLLGGSRGLGGGLGSLLSGSNGGGLGSLLGGGNGLSGLGGNSLSGLGGSSGLGGGTGSSLGSLFGSASSPSYSVVPVSALSSMISSGPDSSHNGLPSTKMDSPGNPIVEMTREEFDKFLSSLSSLNAAGGLPSIFTQTVNQQQSIPNGNSPGPLPIPPSSISPSSLSGFPQSFGSGSLMKPLDFDPKVPR